MKALSIFLILTNFFVASNVSIAQDNQIDSLLRIAKSTSTDSLSANIYYDLAKKYYASRHREAMQWAKEAANYYASSKDTVRMTRCMNLVAVCHLILDNPDEAIRLHFEILKIRERSKDTLGMAETYLNIGNVFYRGRDKQQAISYFEQSRSFAKMKKSAKLLATVNNNLGHYYADKYADSKLPIDFKLAKKYLMESILYKESLTENLSLEKTYQILADLLLSADSVKAALSYANKSEALALKYDNKEAVGSAKMLMSEIFLALGKRDLAKKKIEEFEAYVEQNNASHLMALFDDEKQSLERQINNLDSVGVSTNMPLEEKLLLDRQKVREELRARYESDKKELERKNLVLINKAISDKAERNQLLSVVSLIFTSILVILLVKLYKKNRHIRNSTEEIELQATQLRDQNEKLVKAEKFKSKLFSIISHDLRGPFNSLHSMLFSAREFSVDKREFGVFLGPNKERTICHDYLDG